MELMELVGAAWLSKSVSVAAHLGLADLLEEGPLTCNELADSANCHPESLLRLMRVLSSVHIFRATQDGRFANSPMSDLMRTDHPTSLRFFCMLAGEEYYHAWGALLHTIKTGEPAFPYVFGSSIYEYLTRNPQAAHVYDKAMEDLCRPLGSHIAREVDFSGTQKLVDVGGGSGILIRQLLTHHSHLDGVIFDREDVCHRASQSADEMFGGRLTFLPGDFFSRIPAGADVYILKNILHNWNERSCLHILATVRKAMTSERNNANPHLPKLLVIEPIVELEENSTKKLMNALFQIVICQEGTRERTTADMRTLLSDSGFDVITIKKLPTGHSLIEARVVDVNQG